VTGRTGSPVTRSAVVRSFWINADGQPAYVILDADPPPHGWHPAGYALYVRKQWYIPMFPDPHSELL
jgi:hypothetical protein